MLIIICVLILIILIIGSALMQDNRDNVCMLGVAITGFSGFCFLIAGAYLLYTIDNVIELKIIDQQMEMYQEENSNIQNSISEIIGNYMNYEQGTYAKNLESMDLKSLDIVVLSQLYPDLKANEMVNQQINIYQENNNKVKELKEKKLECKLSKWWLYFGKVD